MLDELLESTSGRQKNATPATLFISLVAEIGSVSDVKVISGHPLLTEAAVTAVRQWRYSPTLLNGEPVPVIATVTVQFVLH